MGRVTLYIEPGFPFSQQFQWKDSAGDPIDITGMEIVATNSFAVPFSVDRVDAEGTVFVALDSEATEDLAGEFMGEFQVGITNQVLLAEGALVVLSG